MSAAWGGPRSDRASITRRHRSLQRDRPRLSGCLASSPLCDFNTSHSYTDAWYFFGRCLSRLRDGAKQQGLVFLLVPNALAMGARFATQPRI